ncbi:MAG TPA: T9SS type A sorting domain-containing protein [Bacteroidota bacterium]
MILSTSYSDLRARMPALRVLCTAILVCVLTMLALTGRASAQAPAGTPGVAASVEIDANFFSGVTFTGATFLPGNDWSQGPTGSALLLQSGGHSVIGLNNAMNSLWFRDENWGTGDDPTQYKGGQKNDQAIDASSGHWAVTDTTTGGGSPQKNDITNCYISTQVDGATGHRWVVAGFETRATNGVSFAGLELDQRGMFVDRSVPGSNKITGRATGAGTVGGRVAGTLDINNHLVGGDILLIVDYTNGGTRPIVSVREWSTNSGGSWTLIADSLTSGKGFTTTNTGNIPAVAPGQGISPSGLPNDTTIALQFVEFGLDLTGLNLLPIDPCNPLATALFQTRSSASFTSSLMDFALGRFAVIPPAAGNAGPDQEICSSGAVSAFTLAGSATNGNPLWSVLSGRVAIADPSSLTTTITDTGTGTAMLLLTVTSTQGCGIVKDTVVFNVNPNPAVSVNSPSVCASALPSTLTATPSGGTGSVTFQWSTGATASTISTSTAGTYSVTVTDTKGCTGSGSGTLTVNPNPTVSVNSPEVCASTLPAILTATPGGGTGSKTFAWSTGATTSTISTSTAGTYSVTVTDTKGCTGTGSGTLTVNPNPAVGVNSPELCASGLPSILTATPSGGTGSKTFAWSTGATASTISTSTAGTYSVTVTDTKGCTGSGSGTLTVNPNPTVGVNSPELCASGLPSTLTATPSGGTGAVTFAWSTGATASTISTSTAGTYSVTVTDAKGCTGSGSGTLTVNPNPTVSVNSPEVCASTLPATLTATPAGGTGAAAFAWSTGATTSTISASTAGTYSVTVTDTKGCTGSSAGTLAIDLNPTVSVNNSSTCQGGAATLTATPAGGTGSAAFEWSTGATTSTISTNTAGTYSVTVTDTKGCTGSGSGTVAVNPGLTVSVNNPEVCESTLPATLTATVSGGTPNYSYSWSTGATTSTIAASAAGTYSVTVTDTKGCAGSESGTLTVNPNPTVSVNSPEVCTSTLPATLTATPAGGTGASSFVWSTGATTSTISTGTAGTYSVTVTDAKGCTGSGSGTLTANPNPTVSVNSPEVCASTLPSTLTATPAGGTGSKTFAWSSGETTSTISTSTAGTYSVTVTDTKGCTGSGSGTLTVNPNPTVSVNSPEVCASTLPATLTATAGGGTPNYSYAWSTGATTSTIGSSTAGTYSVTVTDTKGCTGSSTGTLIVNLNPTVSVNSPEVCASALPATLTATPSGGTGASNFAWSTGATTSTISTSTAGTYSVTVTDTKGCTGSATGTLTVNPNPTVSVNSPAVCGGVAATLTATPAGGTGSKTFAWSSGETTSTIGTSTAGTYSVTVTDTKGCTGSGAGTVTVNPNPTVNVPNVEVCASALPATLTATPTGGTGSKTFAWSTGATTSTISRSTAGTYSVTVTDAKGCTASASGTLAVDPNPTVTVADVSVCPGTAGTLSATASGGTGSKTYAWSTGAATSTITTSAAGTYSVTVTDTKGCTGSGTGRLLNYTPPTVSATGGTITCLQACVQISASPAGLTYGWTGPGGFTSTAQSPTVCDSGTYSVTVTDTHGCTRTASAHVGNVIPNIPACSSTDTITKGFELDGNAVAVAPNPPDDWSMIYNGTASPTLSTGIINDFPSTKDDYFVIGTKDLTDVTSWRYNIQSTPDKDDILHGGAAQYGGKLYFFGDRFDVSGDAQIGFWFLKDTVNVVVPGSTFSGKHRVGDLLVLSNFVKGGGVPQILAYEWVGSGGSDGALDSLPVASIHRFAIVNTANQPSPWPYQAKGRVPKNTFPAGAFFEGGIDVACLTGINPCFANFLLETRSSQSVTASLKDFLVGRFSAPGAAAISQIPANVGMAVNALSGEKSAAAPVPEGYALHPNYPNPFNPTTQIRFDLPEVSTVRLSVFNILGQEVATLVSGTMAAGFQSVEWNTSNLQGSALPSGVYIYRLQAAGLSSGREFHQVMKMMLMK